MSDNPPENASPESPEEKPKRTRGKNDQRIAAEITAADRLLKTISTDPVIQPIATQFGIDAEEVEAARGTVVIAAEKWGVRLEGMAGEDEIVDETATALTAIREAFLAYREIGRANFPNPADRTALGLSGDIPDAFDALMTHIRAAYQAAKKAPYTALFSKRSYTPEKLDGLIQAVDALIEDEASQDEAEGDAMTATRERNDAYKAMKAALKPIKGTLQGALRGRPDLLKKLGE